MQWQCIYMIWYFSTFATMIIIFLLIRYILQGASGTNCSYFEFGNQPPVALNCNPYDDQLEQETTHTGNAPLIWRLRFACEVEKVSGDIGSFDVRWFRQGTDNVVQDLGRLDTLSETQMEIKIVYGMHILNAEFDESMLGDYWCQVMNTTHYFGMSNTLTVLYPDHYDSELPVCSQIMRNETVTCADDPTVMAFANNTLTMNNSIITTSLSTQTDSTVSITNSIIRTRTVSTSTIESIPQENLSNSSTNNIVLLVTTISISVLLLLTTFILLVLIMVIYLIMKFRQKSDTQQNLHGLSEDKSLRSPQTMITSPPNTSSISKPNDYQPIDVNTVDNLAIYLTPRGSDKLQKQTNERKLKQKEIRTTASYCIVSGCGDYQPLDTATVDYISIYASSDNRRRMQI